MMAKTPKNEYLLWVGIEQPDRTQWMEQHPLPGTSSEKTALLKQWHQRRLGRWNLVFAACLCREFFIAIGTLEAIAVAPEAQDFHETQFETLIPNDKLSRGFSRPESLADQPNLFERLPSFSTYRPPGQESISTTHALVVAHRLNKTQVFYVFLAWATITLVLSIVVGILLHEVGLSVATGATIFGFIASLQVAVMWKCR